MYWERFSLKNLSNSALIKSRKYLNSNTEKSIYFNFKFSSCLPLQENKLTQLLINLAQNL